MSHAAPAKPPRKIRLGEVLRATEPDFALVECFSSENQCLITPRCRLRGALREGLAASMKTLDGYKGTPRFPIGIHLRWDHRRQLPYP
jgi:DNA-binding IscR family transcriptional regulator